MDSDWENHPHWQTYNTPFVEDGLDEELQPIWDFMQSQDESLAILDELNRQWKASTQPKTVPFHRK